jgi:dipeptidyl-peptidase-4
MKSKISGRKINFKEHFMKTKFISLFLLLLMSVSFPQKKPITLDDIFLSNKFTPENIENVRWKPDGSAFAFTKINPVNSLPDIYLFDIQSLEEKLFLSSDKLIFKGKQIRMSNYEWTADAKYFIIRGPIKSIWRHSRMSPVYLFNIVSGEIHALANEHTGLKGAKLSPNGKFAGYVKEHNLFLVELSTGNEIQLTFDGSENILNGEFDWVYEEEFSIADGWQWSPDGNKIAFWKFDQTRVKEFYLIDEMYAYNKVMPLKYPKAGEQNAIVKIGIIDLQTLKTTWIDSGENDDIYLPRIYWLNSNNLLGIIKLNRLQNEITLLMADAETGKTDAILTETDSCWVDVEDNHLVPIQSEEKFLWVSEKSGYRHIYLYDYSGKLINQVTSGDWEVTSLQGYSDSDKIIYFYGKKDGVVNQHIYRVNVDGKNLSRISDSSGWHEAIFSPDYKYLIHTYNSINIPLKVYLRKTNGDPVLTLRENDLPALKEYELGKVTIESLSTSDGINLNYLMIYPDNFDPSKKYPVIVYGYGGPGSQNSIDSWRGTRQLWHRMMAAKGFIIFTMDNRGTGGRGKSFKNLAYKDLGKWVVNDHIEAAKFLARLPYVDAKRIGVWGWSGGGTLTLHLMTRAADYFKSGISIAANTDFLLYDTIWSERYFGLPQDNLEAYINSSAKTYAHLLKGNLLLVHGMEDDNVHYQHTIQMAKKLQELGKQFELMLYPNKNHSISGAETQRHLYELMTNFFLRTL